MSNAIERMFDFNARATRLRWWLGQIGLSMAYVIIAWLAVIGTVIGSIVVIPAMLALITILVMALCLAIQRIRDFGWSPAWVLLYLIPGANLIILGMSMFAPTKKSKVQQLNG